MGHQSCQCLSPTSNCPRYGWMKGHKWQDCQGPPCERRDKILDAYARQFANPGTMTPAAPTVPCGDLIEKAAKVVGADRMAKWWEKKTGWACGCNDRRDAMNKACARLERWLRWLRV